MGGATVTSDIGLYPVSESGRLPVCDVLVVLGPQFNPADHVCNILVGPTTGTGTGRSRGGFAVCVAAVTQHLATAHNTRRASRSLEAFLFGSLGVEPSKICPQRQG